MDGKWHFKCKETNSFVVEANEFFTLYSNPSLPHYYDANFIQLNYSPTLEEFILIEKIYRNFQLETEQKHLKIIWPDNIGIKMDVLEYLNQKVYKIGRQELMVHDSEDVSLDGPSGVLRMKWVNDGLFQLFLDLNYKEDIHLEEGFGKMKEKVYRYIFDQTNTRLLLAVKGKQPIGSLIVILSDDYIEIDHVLTDHSYRKQGVASSMIKYVKETFQCPIILAADAEDKPKQLYEKLGFNVVSSQISAILEKLP